MRIDKIMLVALVLVAFVMTMCVGHARAYDGLLYEVSEAVKMKGGHTGFKSSSATLMGVLAAGTPLCPQWLATQLSTGGCFVTVAAVGRANDVTGLGPVSGTIKVLSQDGNKADAPELVIFQASFSGSIDLSPAFQHGRPGGAIHGYFDGQGVVGTLLAGYTAAGSFSGNFRLPTDNPASGQPSYMMDDGSLVPLRLDEYSLGVPTVRLEVSVLGAPGMLRRGMLRR
ncbi:MAG: hypothetical protein HY294_13045 [Candidatus Rokubacteria bacterium]|nr:hypothetical protein [Candidatus Rokubacteria bacterium]MBI3826919.1 hypothetical protein [Candidatus Rokubacteria bacterium]